MIKLIIGYLLIGSSILDAIKYSLQASKIRRVKSAAAQSRKFINFAILNDIIKLFYGIVIIDWFIIVSSLLAIGCMIDLWYTTYIFYPYRKRGLLNFRKPNILLYLINSWLPNKIRKKL
jgi:hypothetical protein